MGQGGLSRFNLAEIDSVEINWRSACFLGRGMPLPYENMDYSRFLFNTVVYLLSIVGFCRHHLRNQGFRYRTIY